VPEDIKKSGKSWMIGGIGDFLSLNPYKMGMMLEE
jgi:hypothetical protein